MLFLGIIRKKPSVKERIRHQTAAHIRHFLPGDLTDHRDSGQCCRPGAKQAGTKMNGGPTCCETCLVEIAGIEPATS